MTCVTQRTAEILGTPPMEPRKRVRSEGQRERKKERPEKWSKAHVKRGPKEQLRDPKRKPRRWPTETGDAETSGHGGELAAHLRGEYSI